MLVKLHQMRCLVLCNKFIDRDQINELNCICTVKLV